MLAVIAAVIVVLVLVATSEDDDGTVSDSTASASPTFQPGTGSPHTAPPTATLSGDLIELAVPEAGGVVALTPGNYRTARFQPEAHFAVPEGWSANRDSQRFLHLFRGGDPDNNCLCLISPDGIVDEDGTFEPLPFGGTVDGMIQWLTGNPLLSTSNPSSLQVGDLDGRQLTVDLADGDEAVEYLAAGDVRFAVAPGERQHLTVLAYRQTVLIIAQRSPAEEYSGYFGFTEQIVGGITFAN